MEKQLETKIPKFITHSIRSLLTDSMYYLKIFAKIKDQMNWRKHYLGLMLTQQLDEIHFFIKS